MKQADNANVGRAFVAQINRIVLRWFISEQVILEVNDLQESDAMLTERRVEWSVPHASACSAPKPTLEQLEQRAKNILDATNLEEIFNGH